MSVSPCTTVLAAADDSAAFVVASLVPVRATLQQGLTLIHFSHQPKPFLTVKSTVTIHCVPRIVLTRSRKVDVCEAIGCGCRRRWGAAAG